MLKNIIASLLLAFVTACASTVHMADGSNGYIYKGEKYGQITVVMSNEVREDSAKSYRVRQLDLDSRMKSSLLDNGAYDEASSRKIEVVINKIHVRNEFNVAFFGPFAGADSLDGTVNLIDEAGGTKASFNVIASYALGGNNLGRNEYRLTWLGVKFAELAAETVTGKKTDSPENNATFN